MSQRTNTNGGIFSGLKVSRRDVRVFFVSTAMLTTVFVGALDIDSHYNAGRVGALVSQGQVADNGICSASKFMR